MLNKEEVLKELRQFMLSYADSIGRIYGRALTVPNDLDPSVSTLWSTIERAYQYGIEGLGHGVGCGVDGRKGPVDGEVTDADMFLHGLSSENMQLFMEEDSVRFPHKCQRIINTAIARHVLDDGYRDLCWDEVPESGYLTIHEVALLADMDERSVRNAAAAKGDGRLVTEQVGKRSLVEVTEARRWLVGRKGYVPSTPTGSALPPPAPAALSADAMHALTAGAATAGMDLNDFVFRRLLAA